MMMRLILFALLLSVASIGAFTPAPRLAKQISLTSNKHVPFMSQLLEEEKVAEKTVEAKGNIAAVDEEGVVEEELSETQNLMQQVKDAGVAGIISYAAWELAFWTVSVPVCIVGYREVTGHWPNLQDSDDLKKLGAEAFAFVNFARFAVPLRIGLALSTTPWIQENVVDRFMKKDEDNCEAPEE